jgi:hypothetical protein
MSAPRIVVDELINWPGPANTAQGNKYFGNGKPSCHLSIEPGGSLEELHRFAEGIGMRRAWFQDHRLMPHYDLTPRRREAAVKAGAVEISAREQTIARRAARAAGIGWVP